MTDPTPHDVETILLDEGFDGGQDPMISVGDTTMLRTDGFAGAAPGHRHGGEAVTEVTLGEMIGEGSDAAVFIGKQHGMRRTVAVRTVHPQRRTEAAAARVLSEGLMLGAFDHPNIIPVYGIAEDADGFPLVLMRAVETVSWSSILHTPGHPLGPPKGADELEFEIRRLIEVCRALEHAHSQSIVHRDVKPDSVMVDSDGSVYLHGWELAVTLVDDRARRFPVAAEQTQIAGTPAYMAPELASKESRLLGPRTDVYLAGATLHHVVTGRPRHRGDNVFDALYGASVSKPVDYDGSVPRELAQILNVAMARDPDDRFETMALFRRALEGFLRRRPSATLAEQRDEAAEQAVDEQRTAVRAAPPTKKTGVVEETEQTRARAVFIVMVVVGWTFFGVFFGAVDAMGIFTINLPILIIAAMLVWGVLVATGFLFGKGLMRELAVRSIIGPMAVVFLGSFALQARTAVHDTSIAQLIGEHLFLFFVAMAMLATWLDWRLIASAGVYLGAFVLAYLLPEYTYFWLGLSNLFGLGSAALVLHPRIGELTRNAGH